MNTKTRTMLTALCMAFLLLLQFPAYASEQARNPTRVPAIGETVTVYTKAEYVLDMSALVFSTMDAQRNENKQVGASGLGNLTKIWVSTAGQEQFTAYCLDFHGSYPGVISNGSEEMLYIQTPGDLISVFAAFLATDTAENGNVNSALFGDQMAAHGRITGFDLREPVTQDMVDAFNRNENVRFEIASATYADGYVHANAGGHWVYTFWREGMAAPTGNFIATAWPSGAAYDRMLWVIEHSYPAIPLEVMIKDAGVDYAALRAEIGDDDLLEAVVYGIIQHAVWYWQPASVGDGVYYGSSLLAGSTHLQQLYSYLTQPRAEHANYRNHTFGATLNVVNNGGAEGTKVGDDYRYGPFQVDSGLLSAGDIQLAVQSPDGYGVSIVNANGGALTSVRQGEEFYVRIAADDIEKSVFDITIQAQTANGLLLDGANRGRMYVHTDPELAAQLQPVGTGGVAKPAQAQDTFTVALSSDYTPPNPEEPTPEEPEPEEPAPEAPKPKEPTPVAVFRPHKPVSKPGCIQALPVVQIPKEPVIAPPKTGDTATHGIVGIVLCVAGAAGLLLAARIRRRRNVTI